MKILLVGGGSGGPVSPLIAAAEEIKLQKPECQFLLVGTKTGPEKFMAEQAGIGFAYIFAGKLRRYFSLLNIFSPVLILIGFFQSLKILADFKPNAVFATGSFVQVPMVWAAWLKKIPVVIHQQDVIPSLANKLCQIAAKKITVTFESSLTDFNESLGIFYKKSEHPKIILTGNPVRKNILDGDKQQALKYFQLQPDLPVLYVVGGGTGAAYLNELVIKALPELSKTVQIIHSTGVSKLKLPHTNNQKYHAYEFVQEVGLAYAAADFVLCRAGLSTITELSALQKVAIIVPMPNSHQEINGALLVQAQAAIVAPQEMLTPQKLIKVIRNLLFELKFQETLKKNISKIMPKNSGKKIADVIIKVAI